MNKLFTFSNYKNWAAFIIDCVEDYKKQNKQIPNLILFNKPTWQRINTAAAGLNSIYKELLFLQGDDFKLYIVMDNELPDNSFEIGYILPEAPDQLQGI